MARATGRVEELLHVKSVEAQILPIDMVWKFGQEGAGSGVVLVTTMETIKRMQWPAGSPDLNHIEHVWDTLRWRVVALNPPLRTLSTLAAALKEQWLALPTELTYRKIESVTHRCMCCIASRKIHTHIKGGVVRDVSLQADELFRNSCALGGSRTLIFMFVSVPSSVESTLLKLRGKQTYQQLGVSSHKPHDAETRRRYQKLRNDQSYPF
ncbi:DDE_3 domain-containing protein [Trichonephila clavipes]|nr:DDE_3 domain-containing protein [Trichonephila clavipes]